MSLLISKESIRYIRIPVTESRTDPDNHVAYEIQVQGPVRSWTVWRRYSEFIKLDQDLAALFPGHQIPAKLPPKRFNLWDMKSLSKTLYTISTAGTSLFGVLRKPVDSVPQLTVSANSDSNNDLRIDTSSSILKEKNSGLEDREFIESRRKGLEAYLQSLLNCQTDIFRDSQPFYDFISPPQILLKSQSNTSKAISRSPTVSSYQKSNNLENITSIGWMQTLTKAERITLNIRHLIEQRETSLSRNDVSTSHQSNLQAKRYLTELSTLIDQLNSGLNELEANNFITSKPKPGYASSINSVERSGTSPKSVNSGLEKLSSIFQQPQSILKPNSEVQIQRQIVTRGEAHRRRDKLLSLMEEKQSLETLIRGSTATSNLKGLPKPSNADKAALLSTRQNSDANSYGDSILKSFEYFSSLTNSLKRTVSGNQSIASSSAVNAAIGEPKTPVISAKAPKLQVSPNLHAIGSSSPRKTQRVFGKRQTFVASETEHTASLNNQQVAQLQTEMMEQQDSKVAMFSEILQRQKAIGSAIGNELEIHNQLLADLATDIDRTGDRISSAKRQANKIS
ncbi:putative syntaxin-8B [Smittium culicis]|uniref:Putative syntaxin-8B n=1 Tax=Smittium culicis TaxID=133412 RepID=A0A1R1YAY7_9FUNG|nr:putative syntaxin-8B [Smittium culicis]